MKRPFCHVFDCRGRPYAYDVNSGDIIEIDRPTAAVLTGAEDGSCVSVTADELRDARKRVAAAQIEQGLFLPRHARGLNICGVCHDASGYDDQVEQLTLSISDQCNLRCRYCLHVNDLAWVRPHRDASMSPETARAAVGDYLRRSRNAKIPSISFYGGEPLLNLDLIRELVALVRYEGTRDDYRIIIDTNGTLLDDETVSFVVDEDLGLQISLDGPARIHDRHRRYRGGRPHPRRHHGRPAPVLARLAACTREIVLPGHVDAAGTSRGDRRLLRDLPPVPGVRLRGGAVVECQHGRPGQRRLHVRADGVYQPCERVGMGLPIGNAERGLDLPAVDRLWGRFTEALGDRCLDCWACRLCSLCFTALAESWRDGDAGCVIPEASCDGVRERLERTFRTYAELVSGDPRSLDFLKKSRVS